MTKKLKKTTITLPTVTKKQKQQQKQCHQNRIKQKNATATKTVKSTTGNTRVEKCENIHWRCWVCIWDGGVCGGVVEPRPTHP